MPQDYGPARGCCLNSFLIMALIGIGCLSEVSFSYASRPNQPEATKLYNAHSQLFKEKIVRLNDKNITVFVNPNGFASNVAVIEGDDGLIFIDTGVTGVQAKYVIRKIRKQTDKPVKAIIYTHHHMDHIGGAGAILEESLAADVKVIAASNFMDEYTSENLTTAHIWTLRAVYQFGTALKGEDAEYYHLGCCGPFKNIGEADFVEPNTLVQEGDELVVSGVRLKFFEMGGESATGISIYLPKQKVVFVGDEIQGPTFPQLHSPRGTKFRDANRWVAGLDKVRNLDLDYLVSGHGSVQSSADTINKNITLYRDAIQYTHDQAIRYINKGYDPDELAEKVSELPAHLKTPLTGEFYGTVQSSVRSLYSGYISWLSGDAVDINPLPKREYSQRMLPLLGGVVKVVEQAESALQQKDYQWAAELAALVLNDRDDPDARRIKAAAFKQLGRNTTSSTFRSWYLTSAMELQGDTSIQNAHKKWFNTLLSDKNLKQQTGEQLLNQLRFKIDAESAGNDHILIAYRFTDTQESYTVELRNAVLEVKKGVDEHADAVIELSKSYFEKIFRNESTHKKGLSAGEIKVSGNAGSVNSFYSYLEMDYPIIRLNLP